jgi:hypothetical protein
MQYVAAPGSGVKPTNLPAVRVVDAHSLAHRKARKAVGACDAADLVDALTRLQNPTVKVAATACGVTQSYVVAALRLSPVQRDAVRRGQRPLISPSVKALPAPVSVEARLADIVHDVGLTTTCTALQALSLALGRAAA